MSSKDDKKQLKHFLAICGKVGVKVKDSYDLEKAKDKFEAAVLEGKADMSTLDKEDGELLQSLGYDVKITEAKEEPAKEEKKGKGKKDKKEEKPSEKEEEPAASESSKSSESGSGSSESSDSGTSANSEESSAESSASSGSGSSSSDEESEAKAGDASSSDAEADKKSNSASSKSGDEKPAKGGAMPPETKDDQTCREWLKEYFTKRATATKSEITTAFEEKFGKNKDGTLHGTLYRAKSDENFLGGKTLVEEKVLRIVEGKAPEKKADKKGKEEDVAKDEKKSKDKGDKKKDKEKKKDKK